jgi:hypothetical protein
VSPVVPAHQHPHTTRSVDLLVLGVGGDDCVGPPPLCRSSSHFFRTTSKETEAVCVVCSLHLVVEDYLVALCVSVCHDPFAFDRIVRRHGRILRLCTPTFATRSQIVVARLTMAQRYMRFDWDWGYKRCKVHPSIQPSADEHEW